MTKSTRRRHVSLRHILLTVFLIIAPTTVVLRQLSYLTRSAELPTPRYAKDRHSRDKFDKPSDANTNHGTASKQLRMQIGEDCDDVRTSCTYFELSSLLEERPDIRSKMDDVCNRHKFVIHLSALECVEDESQLKNETHLCHANSVRPDGSMLPPLLRAFTFVHVRKAGGTTIEEHLKRLQNERQGIPKYNFTMIVGSVEQKDEHFRNVVAQQGLYKEARDQMKHSVAPHPVITVLRDPLSRFASAAGQVIHGPQLSGAREKIRGACDITSRSELPRCIVDLYLKDEIFDSHLIPMVNELYCNTRNHNVQFSLYGMKSVDDLIVSVGGEKGENFNTGENQFVFSASDVDPETVLKLCQIYAADVDLMRSVGFDDIPYCT